MPITRTPTPVPMVIENSQPAREYVPHTTPTANITASDPTTQAERKTKPHFKPRRHRRHPRRDQRDNNQHRQQPGEDNISVKKKEDDNLWSCSKGIF